MGVPLAPARFRAACESCGRQGADVTPMPVGDVSDLRAEEDFLLCGSCAHDLEQQGLWPYD